MQESGGAGSGWREQLMVRPKGKNWLGILKEYQKGQGGQRDPETWVPRGGHGPHHAGPGRPCVLRAAFDYMKRHKPRGLDLIGVCFPHKKIV